ncbi:MAG: histidine phosphatase family protein [gamma proteobacterium symbiont of Taylorina sp.]|nr:histidine phosphatase family protein [gamma proteobacterium symbiont of Taylorina sp.]
MIIDLIRHGAPIGGKMYRGHNIDHPLSEEGWQQMRDSVGDYDQWDQIISSPMIRCHDFAQEVSRKHNIPLQLIDDLKEVGFGAWEGKNAEEIDVKEFTAFYHDPINNRPAGSEPLEDFINRVVQSWKSLLKEHHGKHLLIVAHSGVIRAIITHILYSELMGLYKISIANGKISRIEITKHSGPVLKMINGQII